MVNVDTVYQRVLALANKEQRGYITPQEFNLFANQAQREIFEQYFYDLNQQARVPGNESVYADFDDMLEEKLQIFENTDDITVVSGYPVAPGGGLVLPPYIYRVSRIEYDNIVPFVGTTTYNCEILKTKDFRDCALGGPLTRPNNTRPVANIRGNVMRAIGGATFNPSAPFTPAQYSNVSLTYFKKPGGINASGTNPDVAWGYFVVGNKALYDSSVNKTFNFELHQSEETELVYKILKYAGVSMKRQDIAGSAQAAESMQQQTEKQ